MLWQQPGSLLSDSSAVIDCPWHSFFLLLQSSRFVFFPDLLRQSICVLFFDLSQFPTVKWYSCNLSNCFVSLHWHPSTSQQRPDYTVKCTLVTYIHFSDGCPQPLPSIPSRQSHNMFLRKGVSSGSMLLGIHLKGLHTDLKLLQFQVWGISVVRAMCEAKSCFCWSKAVRCAGVQSTQSGASFFVISMCGSAVVENAGIHLQ